MLKSEHKVQALFSSHVEMKELVEREAKKHTKKRDNKKPKKDPNSLRKTGVLVDSIVLVILCNILLGFLLSQLDVCFNNIKNCKILLFYYRETHLLGWNKKNVRKTN